MISATATIKKLFRGVSDACARKVIAIDIGGSHIKILLARNRWGRVQIVAHHAIDLQEEGLLSAGEVNRHLQDWIAQMGEEPVALVLPQHLSLAHIIDLPRASKKDMSAMIQRDTINFSGLSETSIISDSLNLRPFGKVRNPYWIGIAKEAEVQKLIERLGSEETRSPVCDVVSAAGALAIAFLAIEPNAERVVLADLGATSTVVAIIDQGQCVYTASYPIGSESFTSAIASLQKCSFEEAEAIKRAMNLFTGPHAQPGFLSVVNVWLQDLVKLLKEWEGTNPEIHLLNPPCRIFVSGGGSCQPGLMDYLQTKRGLNINAWPQPEAMGADTPAARFAIAWGVVLACLGTSARTCSLLPPEMRQRNKRTQMLMSVNWFCFVAAAILLCVLTLGSAHKLYLSGGKSAMASEVETALKKAESVESFIQQRENAYGGILPVVEHEKKTMDTISTLQYMQQLRETRDMWFLLLADHASYTAGTVQPETNSPPGTAIPCTSSNQPPRWNSVVLELAISGSSDDQRRAMLREIKDSLIKQPVYQNVDVFLPSQRNTNLLDPRAVLPERHYSLLLDPAVLEKPQPPRAPAPKKPAAASATGTTP